MKEYEIMFILTPEEEKAEERINKVCDIIANLGGNVKRVDKWGIKKMAYEVRYHERGYYVLITFVAPYPAIKELDHKMRIDEAVLRHMIIRKGE